METRTVIKQNSDNNYRGVRTIESGITHIIDGFDPIDDELFITVQCEMEGAMISLSDEDGAGEGLPELVIVDEEMEDDNGNSPLVTKFPLGGAVSIEALRDCLNEYLRLSEGVYFREKYNYIVEKNNVENDAKKSQKELDDIEYVKGLGIL